MAAMYEPRGVLSNTQGYAGVLHEGGIDEGFALQVGRGFRHMSI